MPPRFRWERTGGGAGDPSSVLEEALWEGNGEGISEADVTVETTTGPH